MTDHGHKRKESDGHAASEQSPKKQRTETKEAKTDVRPVFALTVLTHLRQGGPVFPVARAATKEELGQITPAWSKFIGDVLFPADVIHNHVVELGAKINKGRCPLARVRHSLTPSFSRRLHVGRSRSLHARAEGSVHLCGRPAAPVQVPV